jgi:hypothetical protein
MELQLTDLDRPLLVALSTGWRNRAGRLDDHRQRLLSTLSYNAGPIDSSSITCATYHALDAIDPVYAEIVFGAAERLREEADAFRGRAASIEAELRRREGKAEEGEAKQGGGGR